jgi:hypothetical protein
MLNGRIDAQPPAIWLAVIVLIGGLVRFASVIGASFPVGDGGLFATMIEDLRAAGFALPTFTTYNGGDIPFAYPPLGLYLGAILPFDPLTTLQWIPAVLATAAIVPLYFAAERAHSTVAGLAAAAFYALAPFGWFWLVQGGGLTRALAMLLALTALALALRGRAVLTGVAGGLAALTHPETAIFAAVAVLAVFAFARAWRSVLIAGGVSVVVVLPWLALVASRHGLDPFVAAAGARAVNPLFAVLAISSGRPGILDLSAAIGLIGLAISGIGWLYAAAAGTIILLTTSIATHLAPLMAIGVGGSIGARRAPTTIAAATAALLVLGAGVTFGNPEPLGADDRAAMEWVRAETAPDARFVILSDEIWSRSDEAEWFPYLTDRVSVVTMQGREWLPDWSRLDMDRVRLAACTDATCIDDWMAEHDANFIYVADDCCESLAGLFEEDSAFEEGSVRILEAKGTSGT